MRAALWTVFLVVLPGLWFFASGEALAWFCEGEPPRVLRPLIRRLRPHGERLRAWHRRAMRRPVPQPLPPVLIGLELRRLELEIRRVEDGDAPRQAARLRAVLAAYDQLLLELCRAGRRAHRRRRAAAAALARAADPRGRAGRRRSGLVSTAATGCARRIGGKQCHAVQVSSGR